MLGRRKIAVPFKAFFGGGQFEIGPRQHLFLHRPAGVPIFQSTSAFLSTTGFRHAGTTWIHAGTGARFDPRTASWRGSGTLPRRLKGFDTFWYQWSLTHPRTEVFGIIPR